MVSKITVELASAIQRGMVKMISQAEDMFGFPRTSRFQRINVPVIDPHVIAASIRNEGCYDVEVHLHTTAPHSHVERIAFRLVPGSQFSDEQLLVMAGEHTLRQAVIVLLLPEFLDRYAQQVWQIKRI